MNEVRHNVVEPLMYHDGKWMRWQPVRIHGIYGGQPLAEPEPPDLPVDQTLAMLKHDLLRSGYGVIVCLEPGDGTRYTVVLVATKDGFILTSTLGMVQPVIYTWGKGFAHPSKPEFVFFGNAWTNMFLAWWGNCLAFQEVPHDGQ